jgi:hypothetical protein
MATKRANQSCDPQSVAEFDYSQLSPELAKLSKPAQRALLSNGITCAADLAGWAERDLLALHGFGPASLPLIRKVLAEKNMALNKPSS